MSMQLGKPVAPVALAVGPLTLIVTTILQATMQPSGANPSAADAATQFPTMWLIAGVLSVFGPLVWLAGIPAVIDLAPSRGRSITRVGGLLTGAGLAAAIGHLALYFGMYSAIADAGLPADAAKAMETAADAERLGNILLVVFLVCYLLGPIVLTIGLRAAHRVAVWVPITAVLTAGANLFGGPIAGIVQVVCLAATWGAIIIAVTHTGTGVLHEMPEARPAAVARG